MDFDNAVADANSERAGIQKSDDVMLLKQQAVSAKKKETKEINLLPNRKLCWSGKL